MILKLGVVGIGAELFEFLLDYFPAFRMLRNPLLQGFLEAAGPFQSNHPSQAPEEVADGARLYPALCPVLQSCQIIGADIFPLALDNPLTHDLVDHLLVLDAQLRYL